MGIEQRRIEDAGLARGIAALTPEKIAKTFQALIAGEGGVITSYSIHYTKLYDLVISTGDAK